MIPRGRKNKPRVFNEVTWRLPPGELPVTTIVVQVEFYAGDGHDPQVLPGFWDGFRWWAQQKEPGWFQRVEAPASVVGWRRS